MKAALVSEFGSLSSIQVKEISTPEVKDNEVLIQVEYAGVNFPDVLITKGLYQFKPQLPFSPGGEVSGIVVETGPNVSLLKKGDKVMAAASWGGFSQFQKYSEENCFKLPDDFDMKHAAVLLETYATAYHALFNRANLKKDQVLAVLGGAGGTGTAAIQVGKVLGAKVIGIAGSEDKTTYCKEQGADIVINYAETPLKDKLKEIGGVDVIFDPVGGSAAEAAFRAIRPNGKHLVIGFASGEIPALPWNLPLLKSADIVGVFWGGFWRDFPEENRKNVEKILELVAEKKIVPAIHKEFGLEEIVEALEELEHRKVMGKVVIKMNH